MTRASTAVVLTSGRFALRVQAFRAWPLRWTDPEELHGWSAVLCFLPNARAPPLAEPRFRNCNNLRAAKISERSRETSGNRRPDGTGPNVANEAKIQYYGGSKPPLWLLVPFVLILVYGFCN
jgi:hypothetical protein